MPEGYLANPELVEALNNSREATGPEATAEADRAVAERMHLIEKDGVNGPSIDQLREEIRQNYPGADETLFSNPEFVATTKDWYETKILAGSSFVVNRNVGLQRRYESSEKELFNRIEAMGRDIESNDVNGQAGKLHGGAIHAPTAVSASYGSAQHRQEFAALLEESASQEHVQARVLAAGDHAVHPREAWNSGIKASQAGKTRTGFGVSRDKAKGGPSR
ncbi:hypothetical protein [Arthrobacter sp. TMN-50]